MSVALALLLLATPQTASAVDADEYEEIVVEARVGRVALIFDKAADGRLINCRVFKSSGVKRIDAEACTALPDCITDNAGGEYCGKGGIALVAVEPKSKPPATLGLGISLKPETPKVPAVGPIVGDKAEEDPNRLTKLPPPPKDQSHTPAITLSGAPKVEEPR